jgi:hypothetical protein
MSLAPQSLLSWAVLMLLVAALSAACATTMSPERRQRASDCMAQCDAGREPPVSGPMGQPAFAHDMRSDCEKRCQ